MKFTLASIQTNWLRRALLIGAFLPVCLGLLFLAVLEALDYGQAILRDRLTDDFPVIWRSARQCWASTAS